VGGAQSSPILHVSAGAERRTATHFIWSGVKSNCKNDKEAGSYKKCKDKFKEEIVTEETGFSIDKDTGGDTEAINVVCEMENICGVNMPAGYYDTHTPDEYLVVADWLSVLDITERMLSKPLRRYCTEPDRKRPYSSPHGLSGRNIVIPPPPNARKNG